MSRPSVLSSRERKESDTPCPFDGPGQQSLMMGAIAGDATRGYFSTLRYKLRDHPRVLIIDGERFVRTKTAHFAPKHRPPPRWALFFVRALAVYSRA